MKHCAFAQVLVLVSSLAIAQQKSIVLVSDTLHAEFGSFAEQWLSAYNGTDAKQLEPLYTEDAQYISGHVPGLVAPGLDNVIANFQKGMKLGGHIDVLTVLSVTRSCDLATVSCAYEATNSGQKASGRTLLLMKKVGNEWRIYLHMTVV